MCVCRVCRKRDVLKLNFNVFLKEEERRANKGMHAYKQTKKPRSDTDGPHIHIHVYIYIYMSEIKR